MRSSKHKAIRESLRKDYEIQKTSRRNLTVLLNQLRQALPLPDVVLTQTDLVALDPAYIQANTVAFAAAIATAAQRGAIEPLAEAWYNRAEPVSGDRCTLQMDTGCFGHTKALANGEGSRYQDWGITGAVLAS